MLIAASLQPALLANDMPKVIAYSAQPNAYFNERAPDIARIYDGFFFTIGSWDEGVASNLGLPEAPATTSPTSTRPG